MLLTSMAAVLTVVILAIGPFAKPIYATIPVDIGNFEIVVGGEVERFLNIPWALSAILSIAILATSAYLEFFVKMRIGQLPKIMALLALIYAMPLPYIYIVKFNDIVVVLSNYAKSVSLSIFGLAILIAVAEKFLVPQKRARVVADLSITEEKTEKGL
ncbi:hypothetical protein [Pyrobaculum islandicum]|uniref:hypothetical protein n=1 Tax=Pyrobaculum islandicum TaxID=2277 RepID=UPI00069F490F|nr:hypothetical protein [Pyrobaculum islandicum]